MCWDRYYLITLCAIKLEFVNKTSRCNVKLSILRWVMVNMSKPIFSDQFPCTIHKLGANTAGKSVITMWKKMKCFLFKFERECNAITFGFVFSKIVKCILSTDCIIIDFCRFGVNLWSFTFWHFHVDTLYILIYNIWSLYKITFYNNGDERFESKRFICKREHLVRNWQ